MSSNEKSLANVKQADNKESINVSAIILPVVKTLIILVCSCFYLLSIAVVLFPAKVAKVYNLLGAKDAELSCYERVYKSTNNIADLYNLTTVSISAEKHEKSITYIKKLVNDVNYEQFCNKLNIATIKVTDKKYIAYVGDVDSYLRSQLVLALYLNNEAQEARNQAMFDLKINTNSYSFSLATYVEEVLVDNSLSDAQKANIFNTLLTQENIESLIETKLLSNDYEQEGIDAVTKILRVYTLLKIESTMYNIYQTTKQEDKAASTLEKVKTLKNLYQSIIA